MDRREQAYQLRVVNRMGFREIAEKLDVSVSTAKSDCEFIVKMKVQGMIEKDQEMKTEISSIYQAILSRWMPFMMSDKFVVEGKKVNKRGETTIIELSEWDAAGTATDKVLKALDQMAKLEGFYATKNDNKTPLEMGQEFARGIMETMHGIARNNLPVQEAEIIDETPKLS